VQLPSSAAISFGHPSPLPNEEQQLIEKGNNHKVIITNNKMGAAKPSTDSIPRDIVFLMIYEYIKKTFIMRMNQIVLYNFWKSHPCGSSD